MRKTDIVLVVLGVVALIATAAAVGKSDDWTGERTYDFEAATTPLAAQGPTAAAAAPARFEWVAPANATGVRLEVVVNFTGQAVQGGSATVRVGGTAPDGTTLESFTRTLTIAQGSTVQGITFDTNSTWLDVPHRQRDTRAPDDTAWSQPLVITVSVDRPSDLPAARYSFVASVTGTFEMYAARA